MRKRPSLADLEIHGQPESVNVAVSESPHEKAMPKTIYLHPAVPSRSRFSVSKSVQSGESEKFNTLVLEALDLLFKDRGLPSMEEMIREG